MVINQGDIYWALPEEANDTAQGIPHPHVVVQDNVFNHSRLKSVVVCALTTNLIRATWPGNILLEVGEGNLPKPSVVEVSKVSAVNKTQLGEYIGSLSVARIEQILAAMRFLQTAYQTR